jgi:glutamyl-tRNA(Gln) amidotransferase subunit E
MSHDLPVNDPRLRGPLPDYGTWTAEQYCELGLKVGLEIHQQLLTERKLFCRCPAGRYTHEFDAEILRHMRPTLSELGEYDGTALMEFKTRKEIIYRLKNESVCTYEMDDAPPFELNAEALDRAVAIALLLGCQVVGEVHIARKQYLDGSIPTGFQRTAIIGVAGKVPFRGREVFIRQLAIEEDSCREVSDRGHIRTYRTDRLGMPLIETVTDPDLRTPEVAAAAGQLLRRLVRVTGLVRTGAGAARQDVNVSIEGGTRIEIKGVHSLRAIPALVHSEALRQRSLLAIRDVLRERGVKSEALKDRAVDVTPILRATDCVFIRRALDEGAVAGAIPLPGFGGLLEASTQPRTTFLREFSDRVRVIACLDEVPNLVCSTLEGTLSSNEWVRIGKACGVSSETPVLVVWGRPDDVATAGREIVLRAREATLGVPSETRQALDDGTNAFERILPGPNRMYPDTDLPPVRLEDERVQGIAAGLPEPPWLRVQRLRELGVGEDLAERLARHRAYDLFFHLTPRLRAGAAPSPQALASLLIDRCCPRPPSLAAAGEWWERVVDRLTRGEIVPEGIWNSDDEPPAASPDPEARRLADAAFAALPADGPDEPGRREEWTMGHMMRALRGRVPGRRVRAWLKEARS